MRSSRDMRVPCASWSSKPGARALNQSFGDLAQDLGRATDHAVLLLRLADVREHLDPAAVGGTVARLGLVAYGAALFVFFFRVLHPRRGVLARGGKTGTPGSAGRPPSGGPSFSPFPWRWRWGQRLATQN